jgi:hypothetical protein
MLGESSLEARGETFILNLRFMLIVTVFAGNAIEPLIAKMSGIHGLYMWIFSFHMPLFVLVTGYFTKKTSLALAAAKFCCRSDFNTSFFKACIPHSTSSFFT